MRLLKQSTEITLRIGPFVDKGDGVAEETGLASNGTEISKAGAAFATGPTLGTHDAEGWYPVTLTTTHTNTLGPLTIKSHAAATHLPVWEHFMVVPANVYDSLVGGSDTLQGDVTQWNGTAVATPDTAGYPKCTIKDGTGAGEIALTSGKVDEVSVLTGHTVQTGDTYAALPANFSDLSITVTTGRVTADSVQGNVTGSVGSVTGAVGSVTGNVGGNVTGSVGSLAAQAKSDVNAEVLDVLNTDTFTEPGQEAPGATVSLVDKIGYLYKNWRNKKTQDASTWELYDDAGTTVDQKATVSDDGTDFTKNEIGTGP
jgi:hypothetical protein